MRKDKREPGEPKTASNAWGHYRKRPTPTVQQFKDYFDIANGVPVLKQFLKESNTTANWVHVHFPLVELEVHQAVTIGQAIKRSKQSVDYAAVRKQCPRLAVIATEAEIKEAIECPNGTPKVKDLTAQIFARVLLRSKESVKKWAQQK